MGLFAQSLNLPGTPALLNQVTLSMHGVPNQPYILAASDNPGPTVIARRSAPSNSATRRSSSPERSRAFRPCPRSTRRATCRSTFGVPFLSSLIGTLVVRSKASTSIRRRPHGLSKTNGTHLHDRRSVARPDDHERDAELRAPQPVARRSPSSARTFFPGGTTIGVGAKPSRRIPSVATPTSILGTIPPGTPGASADLTVSTIVWR
jgi:hypothetical protein